MSKPKVFLGSSKQNIRVARLLGNVLEADKDVEVTIWDEGVFGLNRSNLENLLRSLDDFDFAVLVLAPDDLTLSKNELSPSARDNVLFECGLFMGRLGRDRVFIVYDVSINLKILSDLDGITLAQYDGSRIGGSDAKAAVRDACLLIIDEIRKPAFRHIVGEWRSKYRLTAETNNPLAEEDIDIKPSKGGLCIISKNNSQDDEYVAQGNLVEERYLMGKWKATQPRGSTTGVFLLTINPLGTIMYGYSTGPDDRFGSVYSTWVLAKKDGVSEDKINERLKRAEELIKSTFSI